MDDKYGRIFTQADVEKILTEHGHTLKEPLPDEFTFPADEPVFVLRAQDRLGLGMVRNYALSCQARRCKAKHLNGIDNAIKAFETWRKDNPDKIKDPD